ncbi:UDP-N-acetylmuramoyl-tripeptide--D-alanyl-D-alanine ligase [Flexithrix dorotheae]|uniref:UDP-N-acetylmuramoyl-tripeptide--D-alanyl-D- alanine ligase n=1 Tax=Flexithrix dorotheae TaxID=70993 RepID=UPI000369E908|nr:UDP-N-acetylmuramoyl-tripeptide--D-alanyl-D-alanine ligase [Flexithrix dorotheae]
MEIAQLYQYFKNTTGISTDTRKIEAGCMFLALKGPNFNGNQYADESLEKGAKYAVVDEKEYAKSENHILVENGLEALQKLANYHRKNLGIPVLAITGSNGKTTTKELVQAVMSKKFKTLATPGNFNNHIGVPLTLLSISPDIEFAIIEMGDNHMGEIQVLCEIAEPDFGVITNIGKDHIEGFGSFENNIRAKSELFDYLLKNNGKAIINSKDYILKNMAKRFDEPVMYGEKGDFTFAEYLGADPFIKYKDWEGKTAETQLVGEYNFENIMVALCIGKLFEIPIGDINHAIVNYAPKNNRSQVVEKGSNTLLLDAYNANPSSVELALKSFSEMKTDKNKVVILGDMLELGPISDNEHQEIVKQAIACKFPKMLFCGEMYHKFQQSEGLFFKEKTDLENFLKEKPMANSFILLKGSRGLKLETLREFL